MFHSGTAQFGAVGGFRYGPEETRTEAFALPNDATMEGVLFDVARHMTAEEHALTTLGNDDGLFVGAADEMRLGELLPVDKENGPIHFLDKLHIFPGYTFTVGGQGATAGQFFVKTLAGKTITIDYTEDISILAGVRIHTGRQAAARTDGVAGRLTD